MKLNFEVLNIAGWILLALVLIEVLLKPFVLGEEKGRWTYSDFIGSVIELILILFALKVIVF